VGRRYNSPQLAHKGKWAGVCVQTQAFSSECSLGFGIGPRSRYNGDHGGSKWEIPVGRARCSRRYWSLAISPNQRRYLVLTRPDKIVAWQTLTASGLILFCCSGSTCSLEMGACCFFPGGECRLESEGACDDAGGEYQGDGTSCVPNPCVGACCFDGGDCNVETKAFCAGLSFATYQGDGTTCDPNPCPGAGACCFDDGECSVLGEEFCTDISGGKYQGDGTTCDPNPCP
jgi:hypothetical protein